MSNGTKRTPDELVTLYELEPELSEVITEGRTDAAVLRWFLNRLNSDTAVYTVKDRLDISPARVKDRGLNIGNRGYVVTAALMVDDKSPGEAARRVTFIYDIDDDIITGNVAPHVDCLVPSDYTSMEMYCFDVKPVGKLLKLTLRAQEDIDAGSVLAAISEPLATVFYARSILARQSRPLGITEAIDRKCRLSGELIRIDVQGLIDDSIGAAGGSRILGIDADSILHDIREAMASCPSDIRLAIRGHDFTRVCCFYLKTRYPSLFKEDRLPYKTPGVFENVLVTCLEIDDLISEPLFVGVMKRYGLAWPRTEAAA